MLSSSVSGKMNTELGNLLGWIEQHRWRLTPYLEEIAIEHRATWGAMVMDNVAKAIKTGDPVAIDLGCEVISDDQKYPFGKLIKSNMARALKGKVEYLNDQQRMEILNVVRKLLNMEFTPRETEDYCKLVSKFPTKELKRSIQDLSPCSESAERWIEYLPKATKSYLGEDK